MPMFRWIRYLVILFIIPIVLMLIYAIPFVHPISTLMIKDVILFNNYDRQWVDYEDISPHLINAVIVSEDGQYCQHNGVDWSALRGVINGGANRGASTIAMQTVKNLYLWPSRSVVRKAIELPYAMAADFIWSKKRMIEIYLNIAQWGPSIYGIEAAAKHHFKTSAKKLTRRQAAFLATSLPNPIARTPAKPSKGLIALARLNQRRTFSATNYLKCVKNEK
jgi:monofunctional glycosyltransferase